MLCSRTLARSVLLVLPLADPVQFDLATVEPEETENVRPLRKHKSALERNLSNLNWQVTLYRFSRRLTFRMAVRQLHSRLFPRG
jgi:hypothetical protein